MFEVVDTRRSDPQQIVRRAGIVVACACATFAGCQQDDCLAGESVVELRVPSASWVVDEFCIDDDCLSADQRQRETDPDLPGPAQFYSYVLPVDAQPDTYEYRVKVTGPDGMHYSHSGDVRTAGNRMGGEVCEPTSATAALSIDDDGELTTQSP